MFASAASAEMPTPGAGSWSSIDVVPEAPHLDDTEAVTLVRDGYNAVADEYLKLAGDVPATHPRRERVEALLGYLPDHSDVLELGCGAGVPVARRLVDAGHRYTGIDLSERQIALARHHVPEAEFRVDDAAEVAFPVGQFDAVLMLYAITHVPVSRWATLARNVHEWLKPGGLFLLNAPGHSSSSWLEEDFLGFGAENWTNALDIAQTRALLARAGLDIADEVQLPDDEPGPGWFWLLARRGS